MVVISAMVSVTDGLAKIACKIIEPRVNPKRLIPELMKCISNKYFEACRVAIADKDVIYQTTRIISDTFDNL